MEDLIYKFLVQSGYSRASIVTDIKSIDSSAQSGDASFVIVDPDTTDRLAVLGVVGPVKAETLIDHAAVIARITHSVGGQQAQGFVVRVDAKAKREAEQVQFYRCYPNSALQQITARTFPDLDTLRVNFKLTAPMPTVAPEAVSLPEDDDWDEPKLGASGYLPAIALLLLAIIDWVLRTFFSTELLGISQSLLLVGGAVLLSVPALSKYITELLRP